MNQADSVIFRQNRPLKVWNNPNLTRKAGARYYRALIHLFLTFLTLLQGIPVTTFAQDTWTGRKEGMTNSRQSHYHQHSITKGSGTTPWKGLLQQQRRPVQTQVQQATYLSPSPQQGAVPVAFNQIIPPSPVEARSDVGFNFHSAPWELVLRRFAQENGLSLQVSAIPPGTFTYYDDKDYSPVEALDLINDYLLATGHLAIQSGTSLIVVNTTSGVPENLIPLVLPENLNEIGRNALASVAIPVHNGIPASAAQEVEQILSRLGSVAPLTSSRRLLVTDTGGNLRRIYELLTGGVTSAENLPTFIYQLRNTPAEEVAKAINEFLTGNSAAATPGGVPGRSGATVATGGAQVVAEPTTNRLLVKGTPEQLEKIRDFIEQIDQAPPQVLIQALLVEVELGNTDEFGVEVGIQDSVLFDRSVIDDIMTISRTITNQNAQTQTDQQIISQSAIPGFNFNNGNALGNNVAINPSRIGSQGLSNFAVGRTNDTLGFGGLVLSASADSVNILLRALAENHHVDILSRPQIRTLDNHEAMIQIGRQVPVVDGVTVNSVGSANPVVRQDQSGIILTVTPRISPDGLVLIDVNAEKSAFQLAPGSGVPIFTDATSGNVIEAPVKDITTAHTSVSMQTGETIVLGGMITRDSITVDRKVPWLGDIPWVGNAFRYDFDQSVRKELLIFLTPFVVQDRAQAEMLKISEINRTHMSLPAVEEFHGNILDMNHGLIGSQGVDPAICPPELNAPTPVFPAQPPMLPENSTHGNQYQQQFNAFPSAAEYVTPASAVEPPRRTSFAGGYNPRFETARDPVIQASGQRYPQQQSGSSNSQTVNYANSATPTNSVFVPIQGQIVEQAPSPQKKKGAWKRILGR